MQRDYAGFRASRPDTRAPGRRLPRRRPRHWRARDTAARPRPVPTSSAPVAVFATTPRRAPARGLRPGGQRRRAWPRMHADRENPDRQQKGDRIVSENSPCQVPEENHARQPADEWKESKGPFGEPPQVDDESLGPEEQGRGDLPIIQRLEKLSISAINEVDRQEALIRPER